MTTEFSEATKHIADELIAISRVLDNKMETWDDVTTRNPDSPNKNVSSGLITKPDATGIEMVLDIQAPPSETIARLRIWGIEIIKDSNDNERFNNIQLSYAIDYAKARQLIERAESLTRDELTDLLHDPANLLDWIIVSDETGKDNVSQQLLGKRYDLEGKELDDIDEGTTAELTEELGVVLERLKQSAAKEVA